MTRKTTRTVSIDEDVDEQLAADDTLNASAVVNSMLREYLAAGKAPDAALTMRKRDVEQELEAKRQKRARIESQIERLETERDSIQRQIEQREETKADAVLTVAAMIREDRFNRDQLNTENPAVQNYAGKADMTPARFVEEVESEL